MYLKTLLTIALLSIFSFLSSTSYAIEIDTYQEELEKENNTPINWTCWIDSQSYSVITPTINLCQSWTPSLVNEQAEFFTWTCNWIDNWNNVSCQINRAYTVSFNSNWWKTPTPQTKEIIYNNSIWDLSQTSFDWYTLKWWSDSKTWSVNISKDTIVLKDTEIFAIWEKVIQNSSSWGWWGWMLIDNCPNWDFSSSFYDWECGEDIKKDLKEKEDIKNPPISNDITKNEDIKIEDPPKKTIKEILNKEKKQCEPNNLVTARKCRFPSVDIDFIDIEKTFAKNYIQLLWKNWIVEWYYDTRLFKPENTISRAEYLKILLRAFCIDYEDQDVSKIPFSDVVKENWEAKVIAKALELWAINSKNKKFRPHEPLTRAESLKIIFDITWVMPKNAYATKFRDVDEFWWEIKYIQTANDMCIVDWYKVDWQMLFKPYKNMNRAEVAKVIANTLQLK